jgi:hypothetical protein
MPYAAGASVHVGTYQHRLCPHAADRQCVIQLVHTNRLEGSWAIGCHDGGAPRRLTGRAGVCGKVDRSTTGAFSEILDTHTGGAHEASCAHSVRCSCETHRCSCAPWPCVPPRPPSPGGDGHSSRRPHHTPAAAARCRGFSYKGCMWTQWDCETVSRILTAERPGVLLPPRRRQAAMPRDGGRSQCPLPPPSYARHRPEAGGDLPMREASV